MRKWFREQNIQAKLIFSYTVLGLFPMLLIAVYTYINTRTLLLNALCEELSAQLEQTRRTLEDENGRLPSRSTGWAAISIPWWRTPTKRSWQGKLRN